MRQVLVGLALLLAGCGSDEPERAPSETLRLDVVGQFEPATARTALWGPGAVMVDATQIGLVELDAGGQVVPGLATSWRVSADGQGYIFRLRDARWPDGSPVSSGDIVAVYRRVMLPDSKHPLKNLLARIVNAPEVMNGQKPARMLGVHDPLPNIVEIRLSAPQPGLLPVLAHPSMSIMRRGDVPVALGAFRIAHFDARPLRLSRNPHFYDAGSVALEGVELLPVSDPLTAIGRFRRNATDIVIANGLAGFNEARTLPLPQALHVEPSYGVYGYVVNTQAGPLADPRIRRALSMVIDRSAIVQRLFAVPAMQPVLGLIPPNLPSYPETAAPDWANWLPEARLDEARRLITEAGFGPQKPLTVEVAIPEEREHAAVLAAVATAWDAIGVRTRALTRRPAAHEKIIAERSFQVALVERMAPADSSRFFLQPFTCRAKLTGLCNPEADRLLDAARTMSDLALRAATIRRAEQLLIDDVPMIPLFVPVRWALVHPRVAGWSDNILGAHPLSRLDVLPDAGR